MFVIKAAWIEEIGNPLAYVPNDVHWNVNQVGLQGWPSLHVFEMGLGLNCVVKVNENNNIR